MSSSPQAHLRYSTVAGDTTCFQCWFRKSQAAGANSNFIDAAFTDGASTDRAIIT